MLTIAKLWNRLAKKNLKNPSATPVRQQRLQVEALETREVPAVGIFHDVATGVLKIEGSSTNDVARVAYASSSDTATVRATLQTDFGYQTELRVAASSVQIIQFVGKNGEDLFVNSTALVSTLAPTLGVVNRSLLLGSPGNFDVENDDRLGVFTVGATGTVGIDYLYKGAGYKGELALYSLEGMENLDPNSTDYRKEAARRALTESELGHVVIKAANQGAKFSANLPWEGMLNFGTYLGVQEFQMKPGDHFGVMLVPNGKVQDVFKNPVVGGSTQPLFSLPDANPYKQTPQLRGQLGDLDGHGSVFAFEDIRLDQGGDRDYNDMVFQVVGARGSATPASEMIATGRNFLETAIGKQLLSYAATQEAADNTVNGTASGKGVFTVGSSGQVSVDWLYDGGGYVGEMGIYSLQGMSEFTPGSPEYIREATRRALSGTVLGHTVLSDFTEGAHYSSATAWEKDFNQGSYAGPRTFKMTAGDKFAVILIPNGSLWEAYNNPQLTGNKRALFSTAGDNPQGATQMVAMNNNSVFGFEDQRRDGYSDQDYNDIVFQILGATTQADSLSSLVNSNRNMTNSSAGWFLK